MTEHQTARLLKSIDEFSWGFEYNRKFHLKKGITFKLGRAGHILGSCFIRFELSNPSFSVVFSGDLGASHTPILPGSDIPEPCDLLIMESTYGNRCHEDRKERIRRLVKALTRGLYDKGKVFIPEFSLGRTQELIYEMDRLFSSNSVLNSKSSNLSPQSSDLSPRNSNSVLFSKIPVFIDSPLGLEITKIYSSLSEYWDKEAKDIFRRGDHPLDFDHLYAVRDYKEHLELMKMPGPAIVIAGSGMCTGGRIVDHLKSELSNPKNDIFFVGYQAKGTSGRDIVRYGRRPGGYVRLDGERVDIRAGVHQLAGYSAHADQDGLIAWVKMMNGKPGLIKLVHGETGARRVLCARLRGMGFKCSNNLTQRR